MNSAIHFPNDHNLAIRRQPLVKLEVVKFITRME